MTTFAPFKLSATPLAGAARSGWWLFLLRGIIALAIGIVAVVDPGATLGALILLLGWFFIVDGVLALVKAVRVMRSDHSWWLLGFSGVAGIVAGLLVFVFPGLTALTLGYVVAFWAIVTGVLELVVAFSLRRALASEILYVVFGAFSVVFGVYVLFVPSLGLAYLTIMIAIYGFVAGFSLIATALRLRRAAP